MSAMNYFSKEMFSRVYLILSLSLFASACHCQSLLPQRLTLTSTLVLKLTTGITKFVVQHTGLKKVIKRSY
jgi:hypothetical protein